MESSQERLDAIRDEAAEKIVRATLDQKAIAHVVADAMQRAIEVERQRQGRSGGS